MYTFNIRMAIAMHYYYFWLAFLAKMNGDEKQQTEKILFACLFAVHQKK